MLKATNIKWDTDEEKEVLELLPTEIIIPDDLTELYKEDREYALEKISDYLSDETGFCHGGFEIIKEITKETVESELFDFFNDQKVVGDTTDIKDVRLFKGMLVTNDNGIIIECVGGKQIKLTIQVN